MTTRKRVTAKDGEGAIALLGRERAGTKTTGYATEMRRCIGSERFGIEAHEAAVSTFPKQPSRKDGLGLMCAEHWKAYVKGLREARATAKPAVPQAATKLATKTATTSTSRTAGKPAAKARTKRERRRTPMAHVPDPKRAKAEALIGQVDGLPGPEHVRRVGDDDVQAALETIANGNGHDREATAAELDAHNAAMDDTAAETPVGETIDGGTGEHVADDAA